MRVRTTMTPYDLRTGLLATGYTPVPIKGKKALLKGWSRVKVDEAEIERWSREVDWLPHTGIRCDNLVAIDIDVTDKALATEVYRLARDMLGATSLARVGQKPKVLLVYRAAPKSAKSKTETGRYQDTSGAVHNVEILRGKGCQFAAFSIHPKTGEPYRWSGAGPLGTPPRDLPGLTDVVIRDFLDAVHATFKDAGLVHEDRGRADGSEDFPRVYDLTDKTVVDVLGDDINGPWEVHALETVLRAQPAKTHYRCTLAGFRDGADGDSGQVELCGDGFLRVSDYVERVVHLRPSVDRLGLDEEARLEVIGEGRAAYDDLMHSWAWVANEDRCFDLNEPLGDGYTIAATKKLFRQVTFEEEDVVSKWLRSKEAHRAHERRFSPRHTHERMFSDGRRRYLNTYVPPPWAQLDADATGLRIWEDFLGHLIPDERERALFVDWLANKVQRPWERMYGVMMVADGVFGTGRGTLASLMEILLGKRYVIGVPFDIFSGASNQAQYYDWLDGTLMICVGEALEDVTDWAARRKTYERIKDIIEPGNGSSNYLPRKRVKAIVGDVYASTFLATNHSESIAIAENDRRILALLNGKAMTERMRTALHGPGGLKNVPEQVAAVYQALAAHRVASNVLAAPEMTEAKRRMVASNVTDLDETFTLFIDRVRPKVFTSAQFRRFCAVLGATHDVDLPVADDLERVLRGRFLTSKGCRQDRDWPRLRMPIDGTVRRVRVVQAPRTRPKHKPGSDDWKSWATSELERIELAVTQFAHDLEKEVGA